MQVELTLMQVPLLVLPVDQVCFLCHHHLSVSLRALRVPTILPAKLVLIVLLGLILPPLE